MNTRTPAILQRLYSPGRQATGKLGILLAGLLMLTTLVGCNPSSNDTTSDTGTGQAVVGLTDAKGDFSSYTVDVTAMTLTKANGAIVNVLPATTRVDFAQYTDMTEFLTAAMVPSGVYVKGTLTLDYSNADIWVENDSGSSVQVGPIVDSDGNPITTMDVSVRLEGRNRLIIAPGLPSHITFDFNLNASNTVTFDADPAVAPTLAVEPFLVADAQLSAPKVHRLRGPLNNVDVAANKFSVLLHPFHRLMDTDDRFGSLTVSTTDATQYEIDDSSYTGSDGLSALAAVPQYTAVIVIGKLKLNPRRFEATEVYAGSSVPGGSLDVVKGNVTARSGNTLSVKGATLIRAGGSVVFNDVVQVTVSDTTRVKKQFSSDELAIGDISVGQRVSVFGTLSPTSSANNLQLDATAGLVRLKMTTLRGHRVAIGMSTAPFVMGVQTINGRLASAFDFTGTGIDSSNNADPANYEINSGALGDLSTILLNAPVNVKGFVAPYGTAPADFNAVSITDLTHVPAFMAMNWNPETTMPFDVASSDSLTLSLAGVGLLHHVARGGVVMNLQDMAGSPTIQPTTDDTGVYAIGQNGSRQWFVDFSNFEAEIEARLADGSAMKRIVARGEFDDSSDTLTANVIVVLMK